MSLFCVQIAHRRNDEQLERLMLTRAAVWADADEIGKLRRSLATEDDEEAASAPPVLSVGELALMGVKVERLEPDAVISRDES